jgi:hypothetical protein
VGRRDIEDLTPGKKRKSTWVEHVPLRGNIFPYLMEYCLGESRRLGSYRPPLQPQQTTYNVAGGTGFELTQDSNGHEYGQPHMQAITRTMLLRILDVANTWSRKVEVLDAFCLCIQARFAETPVINLGATKAVKFRGAESLRPKQDDARKEKELLDE